MLSTNASSSESMCLAMNLGWHLGNSIWVMVATVKNVIVASDVLFNPGTSALKKSSWTLCFKASKQERKTAQTR